MIFTGNRSSVQDNGSRQVTAKDASLGLIAASHDIAIVPLYNLAGQGKSHTNTRVSIFSIEPGEKIKDLIVEFRVYPDTIIMYRKAKKIAFAMLVSGKHGWQLGRIGRGHFYMRPVLRRLKLDRIGKQLLEQQPELPFNAQHIGQLLCFDHRLLFIDLRL